MNIKKCPNCIKEASEAYQKGYGDARASYDSVVRQCSDSGRNAELAEVRADIKKLLKSIDEYFETVSVEEIESFLLERLEAGVKMMRLKNKISEHFS